MTFGSDSPKMVDGTGTHATSQYINALPLSGQA